MQGLKTIAKKESVLRDIVSEKFYGLPKLAYSYADLKPHLSEEQVRIHFEKHHRAYVDGANALLKELDNARKNNSELDVKSALKKLSFNIGGHVLHSMFWENLAPAAAEKPEGNLAALLEKEFGSFERFKWEFSQAALTIEGSGWAALALCRLTGRPLIMQIEKHNANIYPAYHILLVLDMFEHAYYIDYKNEKAKYAEAFWKIANWDCVGRRLIEALGEKESDVD